MYDGEHNCNMEYNTKCPLHPIYCCKGDQETEKVQPTKPEPTNIPCKQYGECGQEHKETIRISSRGRDSRSSKHNQEPKAFPRSTECERRIIFLGGGPGSLLDQEEENKKEYTFNFNFK